MGDEYIDIKDLSITIPSKAKDVDLITFKSIMAQVELYSNELKSNMNLSHSLFVDHVENDKIHKDSGEVAVFGDEPDEPVEGTLWFDENTE